MMKLADVVILGIPSILYRSDTNEYVSRFDFFFPEPATWTSDVSKAFQFRTHEDAESNARIILDRLGDPTNRIGLMIGEPGKLKPVCVTRVG